jgi:hypothetical protein
MAQYFGDAEGDEGDGWRGMAGMEVIAGMAKSLTFWIPKNALP